MERPLELVLLGTHLSSHRRAQHLSGFFAQAVGHCSATAKTLPKLREKENKAQLVVLKLLLMTLAVSSYLFGISRRTQVLSELLHAANVLLDLVNVERGMVQGVGRRLALWEEEGRERGKRKKRVSKASQRLKAEHGKQTWLMRASGFHGSMLRLSGGRSGSLQKANKR